MYTCMQVSRALFTQLNSKVNTHVSRRCSDTKLNSILLVFCTCVWITISFAHYLLVIHLQSSHNQYIWQNNDNACNIFINNATLTTPIMHVRTVTELYTSFWMYLSQIISYFWNSIFIIISEVSLTNINTANHYNSFIYKRNDKKWKLAYLKWWKMRETQLLRCESGVSMWNDTWVHDHTLLIVLSSDFFRTLPFSSGGVLLANFCYARIN